MAKIKVKIKDLPKIDKPREKIAKALGVPVAELFK
jgi:hypothetical protein